MRRLTHAQGHVETNLYDPLSTSLLSRDNLLTHFTTVHTSPPTYPYLQPSISCSNAAPSRLLILLLYLCTSPTHFPLSNSLPTSPRTSLTPSKTGPDLFWFLDSQSGLCLTEDGFSDCGAGNILQVTTYAENAHTLSLYDETMQ